MAEAFDFPGLRSDEEEDKERAKACLAEIVEVLRKHHCLILPEFAMTGPNFSWGVRVVAKKPEVPLTSPN